jgi:hypothetical protein
MYYYQDENGNWHTGKEIHLPDASKLTDKDKTTKNGWVWHDEPPRDYITWLEATKTQQQ